MLKKLRKIILNFLFLYEVKYQLIITGGVPDWDRTNDLLLRREEF